MCQGGVVSGLDAIRLCEDDGAHVPVGRGSKRTFGDCATEDICRYLISSYPLLSSSRPQRPWWQQATRLSRLAKRCRGRSSDQSTSFTSNGSGNDKFQVTYRINKICNEGLATMSASFKVTASSGREFGHPPRPLRPKGHVTWAWEWGPCP